MGCCAIVMASWISPRFVLVLMWIFGDKLSFAFDSFWQGLLGFAVLPWTTLCYALATAPVAGVSGIGWLFVAMGLVLDLATWFGGGYEGRNRYVDA